MSIRRWRLRAVVVAVAALAVVAVLATGGVSQGSPGHPYLALGDSVTFGYITQAGVIQAAAHANGAVVADVFSAFQQAAAGTGGHTCAAGLLNASPQNQFTCDVHPSQSGQQLLARTVAATYDNS